MESRLGSFDLSSFVCPITNAILDEPMLAEDGRTYSKNAILAWFKSRSERQLPITSPCTRKPISESLVPNADIAKSIEEYRKGRQGERSASGKAAAPPDCCGWTGELWQKLCTGAADDDATAPAR